MRTIQILTGKRGLGHFARAREIRRLVSSIGDGPSDNHLVVVSSDQARRFPGPLPTNYREWAPRSAACELRDLIGNIQPDVVFVDNRPEGPHDALLSLSPTAMRGISPRSRIVLATRDVLDSRPVMTKAWASEGIRRLIDDYDDIWCFGDEKVFDFVSNYDVARGVRYLGYLAAPTTTCEHPACPTVVTVASGGGSDSTWTIGAVRALETVTPLTTVRVIIGPHSPAAVREFMGSKVKDGLQTCERHFGLTVEPACGSLVVGMAGYNTVAETVRSGRRLLAAPRTSPTAEQMVRAEAFALRGHVSILPIQDPSMLTNALRSAVAPSDDDSTSVLPVRFADEATFAHAFGSIGVASKRGDRE